MATVQRELNVPLASVTDRPVTDASTTQRPADGGAAFPHLSVTSEGVRRVDVDELYDSDADRPLLRHVLGKPMFLY